MVLLKSLYDYQTKTTVHGSQKDIEIKNNLSGNINIALFFILLLLSTMTIFSGYIYYKIAPVKSSVSAKSFMQLIPWIFLLLIALNRQKLIDLIKGFSKFDRQMSDTLGHFIWAHKLFLYDDRKRITDSATASYCIDGQNIVIGLNPHGMTFTKTTQEMGKELASLFPRWELIDTRPYASHTEYIFALSKVHRINNDY